MVSRGTNQEDLAGVGGSEVVSDALGVGSTGAGANYYTRTNTGELLAQRTTTASATKYFLKDPLDNVSALTDTSGTQTAPSSGKYYYDPYGNNRGSSVPTTFGWASAYQAPGYLMHFGYRYYDPYTGSFTQQDPINQADDLTQADHYPYAGDDPVNSRDLVGTAASPCSPSAPRSAAGACRQLEAQKNYSLNPDCIIGAASDAALTGLSIAFFPEGAVVRGVLIAGTGGATYESAKACP